MMAANANTAGENAQLHAQLQTRNRIVGVLRIVVPVLGAALLFYLLAQIALSRLGGDFDVGPVRFDRSNLVFDDPRYHGVTADGMTYSVQAESATTPIGSSDAVQLTGTEMTMFDDGAFSFRAEAPAAVMNVDASRIAIEGVMDVVDARGTRAQMFDSNLDWENSNFTSSGPVHVDYHSGITIEAETLSYDRESLTWRLERVHMQIPAELNQ
jgi:hypothetical protein